MTRLGLAYAEYLPTDHQKALFAAAEILSDSIFDDMEVIRGGAWDADATRQESIEQSNIASSLPARYRLRYTSAFMKRFHMCLLTVIWKLGQHTRMQPSCVAEELAAHILIEEAESWLEVMEDKDADFHAFEDSFFDDLDHELLYDDAYDGIEDAELADRLGMAYLAFADWFKRFGDPDDPHDTSYTEIHPLAESKFVGEDNGEAPGDTSDA